MKFHYGDCRNVIEDLEQKNAKLRKDNVLLHAQFTEQMGLNHEAKAVYHYALADLEGQIAKLKAEAVHADETISKQYHEAPEYKKFVKKSRKIHEAEEKKAAAIGVNS